MASFLSNIFGDLFGGSSNSAIGIDIGSSTIKVVQLQNEGGVAKLETYGALAVGPYADKPVGQAVKLPINTTTEALTDLLGEAKTTTTNGGIAIPFSSTLMNVVELPRVKEEELEKMVPIEARKYIPASMEEINLDWTVISDNEDPSQEEGNEAQGTVSVLMVAIHNDVVERYQRIVDKAELHALFFEVEIFSTIRAVMAEEKAPVLVFDMGAASVKLYIIEKGVVRKTHTVNQGSQDITAAIARALQVDIETAEILKRGLTPEGETQDRSADVREAAEPVINRILAETEKVRRSYERNGGASISRCIMVGGGVLFDGFAKQAKEHFDLPTELGNPFKQFETPEFLDDVLAEKGPEFAVAAGIALRKLQEG